MGVRTKPSAAAHPMLPEPVDHSTRLCLPLLRSFVPADQEQSPCTCRFLCDMPKPEGTISNLNYATMLYIPRPIRDVTSRSPTASGSCLAISIIVNSFLIPMFSPFASESPPKPACCSICIVCWRSRGLRIRSTSSRITSRPRRLETGGTRISESKLSDRPRSVKMGRREVVAITSKRRPLGGRLLNSTSRVCKTEFENLGPIGVKSKVG